MGKFKKLVQELETNLKQIELDKIDGKEGIFEKKLEDLQTITSGLFLSEPVPFSSKYNSNKFGNGPVLLTISSNNLLRCLLGLFELSSTPKFIAHQVNLFF